MIGCSNFNYAEVGCDDLSSHIHDSFSRHGPRLEVVTVSYRIGIVLDLHQIVLSAACSTSEFCPLVAFGFARQPGAPNGVLVQRLNGTITVKRSVARVLHCH